MQREVVSQSELVAWGPTELRVNLRACEKLVRSRLSNVRVVESISLDGSNETFSITVWLRLAWFRVHVLLPLKELRVANKKLGFRVGKIRTVLGIPVPWRLVAALAAPKLPAWIKLLTTHRIVVVELSQWWPKGLEASLKQVGGNSKELVLKLEKGAFAFVAPKAGGGDASPG